MTIDGLTVHIGDCRESMRQMPEQSVQTCVTSPPYFGLRDYGHDGQIGLEPTPDEFVAALVEVFREVRRVLRDDGTVWLNIGDSYNNAGSSKNGTGLDGKQRGGATGPGGECGYKKRDTRHAFKQFGIKHKDLIGIPWRLAFALQADGWYLRQDLIWHKPNPMPESVTDRCTKAHEYIFLLTKSARYYFDAEAIAEASDPANNRMSAGIRRTAPGSTDHGGPASGMRDYQTRNRRSVWTVSTKPYSGAHFATFPPDLIEPCILAGSKPGDVVLDPFGGSGTTAGVALKHGRQAVLCELNPEYAALIPGRVADVHPHLNQQRLFA